jgi:hypothetical protein
MNRNESRDNRSLPEQFNRIAAAVLPVARR